VSDAEHDIALIERARDDELQGLFSTAFKSARSGSPATVETVLAKLSNDIQSLNAMRDFVVRRIERDGRT
jgi:hypothetical protein